MDNAIIWLLSVLLAGSAVLNAVQFGMLRHAKKKAVEADITAPDES